MIATIILTTGCELEVSEEHAKDLHQYTEDGLLEAFETITLQLSTSAKAIIRTENIAAIIYEENEKEETPC